MEVIRRYTEITALDESILFELVDRIEVGEARKVTDSASATSRWSTATSAKWTTRWRRRGRKRMKKLYKVGIYCRLSVDSASNSAKAKKLSSLMNPSASRIIYELLSKFNAQRLDGGQVLPGRRL